MSGDLQNRALRKRIRQNNRMNAMDRFLCRIFHTDASLKSMVFMKHLQEREEAQDLIRFHVLSGHPFLFLRFGLYEYQLCYQYLEKRNGKRERYTDFIREHIRMDAGILAENDAELDRYAKNVIENLYEADVLAYWRNYPENHVFGQFYGEHVCHIKMDDVYPFPFLHRFRLPDWQACLEGKKVLVVTSFAETVKSQYARRTLLWKDADYILPEFELSVYKSVQTNGGATDGRFASWSEAVDYMETEIMRMDFDIALVSCGGYGLPLSIQLKKRGKMVIQWGGCFQLWFGIMGGRWKDDSAVREYVNEYWVYPSESETPPLADQVNGSAYW